MITFNSILFSDFNNLTYGFIYNFNSYDKENILEEFYLDELVTIKQIHSDNIYNLQNLDEKHNFFEGDSILTKLKNIGIGVYTADCVPILIYETTHNYISVVHAGWKGSLSEIVKKTIEKINSICDSEANNYYTVIGPSIGRCCYEVGDEVASKFISKFDYAKEFIETLENKKYLLDLVSLNQVQLERSGVKNIEVIDTCTKCNKFLPSFRRDGTSAGRILSFIAINE